MGNFGEPGAGRGEAGSVGRSRGCEGARTKCRPEGEDEAFGGDCIDDDGDDGVFDEDYLRVLNEQERVITPDWQAGRAPPCR